MEEELCLLSQHVPPISLSLFLPKEWKSLQTFGKVQTVFSWDRSHLVTGFDPSWRSATWCCSQVLHIFGRESVWWGGCFQEFKYLHEIFWSFFLFFTALSILVSPADFVIRTVFLTSRALRQSLTVLDLS